MPGLRALTCLLVVAMAAGCVQPIPPVPAAEGFPVPAPSWSPGYSWTFTTSNATASGSVTYTVGAPHDLDGMQGMVGYLAYPEQVHRGGFVFDVPGRLNPVPMQMYGAYDDICRGDVPLQVSRYAEGLTGERLRFPLAVGSTWQVTDFVVNEFRVLGIETVEVPAGRLDAVRIEVHSWFPPGGVLDEFHNKTGSDEAGARRHGPVALMHYAPAAQNVVRIEYLGRGAWANVPGAQMLFWPIADYDKDDYHPITLELDAYSLVASEPLTNAELAMAAAAGPDCEMLLGLEEDERRRAEERYWRDNPPTVTVHPAQLVLSGSGAAEWQAQVSGGPPGATLSWHILAATAPGSQDGEVLANGTSTTFHHEFATPGAYWVVAELRSAEGNLMVREAATAVVNQRIVQTVPCLAAADATWFSPGSPKAGGCDPLTFTVGPGFAILDAEVTGRVGDATAPCSYLELLDPAGAQVEWVFSDRIDGAQLVTVLGPYDAGDWTFVWHPALTVASEAAFDISLEYIAPDQGFSFSGPGSPGC